MLVLRNRREADPFPPFCEVQKVGTRDQKAVAEDQVGLWMGGGAPSIRRLFGDERAVPAVPEFLEDTRVGKVPSRVLLAGGPDLEEEELEGFFLRAQREEEGTGVSASEEEDGPGPPS